MTHLNASVFSDSKSVRPFDSLPTEVISYLFHSLSYEDLKSARLVCRKWYLAGLDPKLTSQEKFVIEYQRNCPQSDVIPVEKLQQIKQSKRDSFDLEIKGNSPIEWCDVKFFSEIGHKLKSLTLRSSIGSKDDLFGSLHQCLNLQHLSIQIGNIIFSLNDVACISPRIFPALLRLESLELVGITLYNLGILQIMISNVPSLKSIHLKRDSLKSLDYQTFVDITNCLKQNSDYVFGLSLDFLNGCSISLTLAKRLDEEEDPNVRLCALHTHNLPQSLHSLCQFALKELVLTYKVKVTNEMFASICSNCVNLEKLECSAKSLSSVAALSSLVKLTRLTLAAMHHIKDECLVTGLCSEVNTRLKEVSLLEMCGVSPRFIVEFARTHPAITNLNLTGCYGLNDASVQAIFKYQTALQVFRIPLCRLVTDVGLSGTVVDISDWRTGGINIPTGYSIARLADLQLLDLYGLNMEFTIFKSVKFAHLRDIGLGKTRILLTTLELLIENHPDIRNIDASRLPIKDDFLRLIVRKLPKLENIAIDDCRELVEAYEFLSDSGISHSSKLWSIYRVPS